MGRGRRRSRRSRSSMPRSRKSSMTRSTGNTIILNRTWSRIWMRMRGQTKKADSM